MAKPERLIIGRVAGVFGVRGELKIQIETDFPERFKLLKRVFVCDEEHTAEQSRLHDQMALLKLQGIDSAAAAARLNGCDVAVAIEDAVALEPGRYYIYEIEGLQVETTDGEALGVVSEVLQTGANDVYVVRSAEGKEILLPAIKQVVKRIDVPNGKMLVELMEGLR